MNMTDIEMMRAAHKALADSFRRDIAALRAEVRELKALNRELLTALAKAERDATTTPDTSPSCGKPMVVSYALFNGVEVLTVCPSCVPKVRLEWPKDGGHDD